MEDFVSFNINGKEFDSKFCKMLEAIEEECRMLPKNFERLKTIELNQKSFVFAEWTSKIYLGCDEFYPDFDPNDPSHLQFAKDEEEFRSSELLLQILF